MLQDEHILGIYLLAALNQIIELENILMSLAKTPLEAFALVGHRVEIITDLAAFVILSLLYRMVAKAILAGGSRLFLSLGSVR